MLLQGFGVLVWIVQSLDLRHAALSGVSIVIKPLAVAFHSKVPVMAVSTLVAKRELEQVIFPSDCFASVAQLVARLAESRIERDCLVKA